MVKRNGRRRAGMLDRRTEGTLLERAVKRGIGFSSAVRIVEVWACGGLGIGGRGGLCG